MRLLTRIAGFILAFAVSFASAQAVSAQQISPQQARQTVTRSHPSGDLLDINTATAEQLKALPGFGEAYVRRVIAGRPYTAKNQLVTRGILPQSAYRKISSQIVAHRPQK